LVRPPFYLISLSLSLFSIGLSAFWVLKVVYRLILLLFFLFPKQMAGFLLAF